MPCYEPLPLDDLRRSRNVCVPHVPCIRCSPVCSTKNTPPFLCRATDQNNLVAQFAHQRSRIRHSKIWLAINLLTIVILTYFDYTDTWSWMLLIICVLNVCYYVISLLRLYIYLLKLDGTQKAKEPCRFRQNYPKDLIRYFENSDIKFLCAYWERFYKLVDSLKDVRYRGVIKEVGIESELRNLEQSMKKNHFAEWKRKAAFQDARYQWAGALSKYDKKTLTSQSQLKVYWERYSEAAKDDSVRHSRTYDLIVNPVESDPQWCAANRSCCLKSQKLITEDNCDTSLVVRIPAMWSHVHKDQRSKYKHSTQLNANQCPAPDARRAPLVTEYFAFMKHHYKEDCSQLYHWVANVRCWVSSKIKEVVEQFDIANAMLKSCGISGVQIGVSNIGTIQMALESRQQLKSFSPLVEFLTLTHNQGYLLWRYRFLASDRCLKPYSWNSGGDTKGYWAPEIGPCDSEIVLHFFSSYLDMKLPCYPSHPSCKRPFSDSYVVLNPSTSLPSYSNLAIVQQWVSPPHYNVIVGGQTREIPGGNCNLFLALAYLIFCIKVYQDGKIGRISLGRHGLNILWVVGDEKHL